MVLTQATGLSRSADSVMAAITALPGMPQLSVAHVRRDIIVPMETHPLSLSLRPEVNIFPNIYLILVPIRNAVSYNPITLTLFLSIFIQQI